MTTRQEAAYQIVTDLDLSALGITSAAQVHRGVGTSKPKVVPFINLAWGLTSSAFGVTSDQLLNVWVYDEGLSYCRIDAVLVAVRDAFIAAPELMGDVTWNGFSEDAYDDQFELPTRYAVFTVPAGTA